MIYTLHLDKLQKNILRSAVSYLKEGGVLIYSTCTINKGENAEIAEFIEKEMGLHFITQSFGVILLGSVR